MFKELINPVTIVEYLNKPPKELLNPHNTAIETQRFRAEFMHKLADQSITLTDAQRTKAIETINRLVPRNLANDKHSIFFKTAILEAATIFEIWSKDKISELAKVGLISTDQTFKIASVRYLAKHPDKKFTPLEITALASDRSPKVREIIAQECIPNDETRFNALIEIIRDKASTSTARCAAFNNLYKYSENPERAVVVMLDSISTGRSSNSTKEIAQLAKTLICTEFTDLVLKKFKQIMFDLNTSDAVKVEISRQVMIAKIKNLIPEASAQDLTLEKQLTCRHLVSDGWISLSLPENHSDPLRLKFLAERNREVSQRLGSDKPIICTISNTEDALYSPSIGIPETYIPTLMKELGIDVRDIKPTLESRTNETFFLSTNIGELVFKREKVINRTTSSAEEAIELIPKRFRVEHKLMGLLRKHEIPAPEILAIGRVDVDGECSSFTLQRRVSGMDGREEQGGQIVLAFKLGKYLARLHQVKSSDPELFRDKQLNYKGLIDLVDDWQTSAKEILKPAEYSQLRIDNITDKLRVLGRNFSPTVLTPRVIHFDAHLGNILVQPDSICMIDWEFGGTSRFPEVDFRKVPRSLLASAIEGYETVSELTPRARGNIAFICATNTIINFTEYSSAGYQKAEYMRKSVEALEMSLNILN